MSEKPLHIKVAEVLGWTNLVRVDDLHWSGDPNDLWPEENHCDFKPLQILVPHYPSDWAATGPEIERLRPHGFQLLAREDHGLPHDRRCCAYIMGTAEAWGRTELVAVCGLIVELGRLGKASWFARRNP